MQKLYFLLICSTVFILTNSCLIEVRGLISGYQKIKKYAPEMIACAEEEKEVCSTEYDTACPLLITNAPSIKQCLQQQEQALVYVWNSNCQREGCYLLDVLQDWCRVRKVKLYVVAQYYDLKMRQPYQLEYPILAIDQKHYNTNWSDGYINKFMKELTGKKEKKKIDWKRLSYFQKGRFKGFFRLLEDVPTQ